MEKTQFLATLASRLQRDVNTTKKPARNWQHRPQEQHYTPMNNAELLVAFKEQCTRIHTDVVETTRGNLSEAVEQVVAKYGGPLSVWDDPRFAEYGLTPLFTTTLPAQNTAVYTWSHQKTREENFAEANAARIGLVFSEYALAESGTVVLYSADGAGKAVGLLPHAFVAIIPQSSLLPRMTQASQAIQQRVARGELLPHAIDYVSGPSNSADIEMKLVVGVHGPVEATYIVLTDC